MPSKAAMPPKLEAVADTGGHGDDGSRLRGHHRAGQRAFHAGADDDNAGAGQSLAIGQQAVNAGDADVVEMLHFVAHDFGSHDGLFSDRNVAGPGGDDGDDSLAIFCGIALQHDGAGDFAIFCGRELFS